MNKGAKCDYAHTLVEKCIILYMCVILLAMSCNTGIPLKEYNDPIISDNQIDNKIPDKDITNIAPRLEEIVKITSLNEHAPIKKKDLPKEDENHGDNKNEQLPSKVKDPTKEDENSGTKDEQLPSKVKDPSKKDTPHPKTEDKQLPIKKEYIPEKDKNSFHESSHLPIKAKDTVKKDKKPGHKNEQLSIKIKDPSKKDMPHPETKDEQLPFKKGRIPEKDKNSFHESNHLPIKVEDTPKKGKKSDHKIEQLPIKVKNSSKKNEKPTTENNLIELSDDEKEALKLYEMIEIENINFNAKVSDFNEYISKIRNKFIVMLKYLEKIKAIIAKNNNNIDKVKVIINKAKKTFEYRVIRVICSYASTLTEQNTYVDEFNKNLFNLSRDELKSRKELELNRMQSLVNSLLGTFGGNCNSCLVFPPLEEDVFVIKFKLHCTELFGNENTDIKTSHRIQPDGKIETKAIKFSRKIDGIPEWLTKCHNKIELTLP